jgi:hypothetical protein
MRVADDAVPAGGATVTLDTDLEPADPAAAGERWHD